MTSREWSYVFGNFRLDPRQRKLYKDDREQRISEMPYELLLYLVSQAPAAVRKRDLLAGACFHGHHISEQALKKHFEQLYRILGDTDRAHPAYIERDDNDVWIKKTVSKSTEPPHPPSIATLRSDVAAPTAPAGLAQRIARRLGLGTWKGRAVFSGLVVVPAVVLGAWSAGWLGPAPKPAQLSLQGQTIRVLDDSDREVWTKEFTEPLNSSVYEDRSRFLRTFEVEDIDGDGKIEVLFARFVNVDGKSSDLICYSSRGKEKWRFTPGRPSVSMKSGKEFRPPYFIHNFQPIVAKGGRHLVVVSSSHLYTWSAPSQLAVLDASNGRVLGEYWHPGPLHQIVHAKLDADGAEDLIVGGMNFGLATGAMLVFDPLRVSGASDEGGFNEARFSGFGPGSEKHHVLFFPGLSQAAEHPAACVADIRLGEGRLFVHVAESRDGLDKKILGYELNGKLELLGIRYSDEFATLYDKVNKNNVDGYAYPLVPKGLEILKEHMHVIR
jgi:hypothetical protein